MRLLRNIMIVALAAAGILAAEAQKIVPVTPDTAKEQEKGEYIFVPDSLTKSVKRYLKARSNNFNEKVIVRGDTVDLIIKEKNFGRYDRGLLNYLFIPKGTWNIGMTVSYGEFASEDMQLLQLLTDFDFRGHTFSIKPYFSYFIKNNLSVGLRFGYTSAKGNLDRLAVDIDEDLNFDISDAEYKNESYAAAFDLRHYIGLSRAGRFGVYNEVELAFSSGNSDFTRLYGGEPKLTHTTYLDTRISFSPGVCVFIMKNVAFNLSFGVFGFYFHKERQFTNGEESGERFTSGADFKLNIFNLNFGIGVYL